MILKLFKILSLFITLSSVAYAKDTLFIINYETKKNDSIKKIFYQFLEEGIKYSKKNHSVKATRENNPHIEDWNKIPSGIKLKVYIGVNELDKKKFFEFDNRTKSNLRKIDNRENFESLNYFEGLKSSIYYMYFMGDAKQSNGVDADVSFTQKGLLTLGWQGNYYFRISNHSLGMGIAFSELDMIKSNYGSGSVNQPTEINSYIYGEFKSKNVDTTFLYGLDYEKSSSFDLAESNNQGKIIIEDNNLTYGTLGFARSFNFFSSSIFSKLTFSKTLFSKSSSSEKYSGYKTNFYLNKKMNKDFYLFTNFRYQSLSDESELQIIRFGFGFGILF